MGVAIANEPVPTQRLCMFTTHPSVVRLGRRSDLPVDSRSGQYATHGYDDGARNPEQTYSTPDLCVSADDSRN